MLRLLHPFMPFITEELWQRLAENVDFGDHRRSISLEQYPKKFIGTPDDAPFVLLQDIVRKAREQRTDRKLDPKGTFAAMLRNRLYEFNADDLTILSKLTKLAIEQVMTEDLDDAFRLRNQRSRRRTELHADS